MELPVPVHVVQNRKIRLKLTDYCNLQCPFCHSEGAAGANDISITDDVLLSGLQRLRSTFDYVHLTGGEPTSYKHLNDIVKLLHKLDFKISITSNGLFNLAKVRGALLQCEYINISFHTLSSQYFKLFLPHAKTTKHVIDSIAANVDALRKDIPLRFNTVVTGSSDEQDLCSVHEFADSKSIPLKLVPDWRTTNESKRFILEYLTSNGYELSEIVKVMPGSNVRRIYHCFGRAPVELKDIEPFRPDFLCEGCTIKDRCVEAFSFVRIERSPAQFRLCIYKPAMEASSFFKMFDDSIKPLFRGAPAQL